MASLVVLQQVQRHSVETVKNLFVSEKSVNAIKLLKKVFVDILVTFFVVRKLIYLLIGLMAGFREGGKSVIGGFATGFKGIASKPIEEGRKGGAIGFMKGLGMGVVGAAVNPILGVTDGISAVADSVSNHLKANDYNSFVRPPRALERSAVDAADLILVPIDNFKACAQQLMYTLAMKKSISDTYVSLRYLGYRDDDIGMKDYYAILFSKKFVRMLTAATEVLWEIQYSDLSHFGIDIGSNSVDLFLNNGNASKTKRFTVKCYDIFSAVGLFEMLSLEKDQMTNGRNIVTVNNVKERVQGKK